MIGQSAHALNLDRSATQLNSKPSPLTLAWRSAHERLLAGTREWRRVRGRAGPPDELAGVFQTTPDFVFTSDRQGHLRFCNPAARRALGLRVNEDVSPIHLADIYAAGSRNRVLGEGIMTAILDGAWSGEALLLTRARVEIPVSLVIVAESAANEHAEFLTFFARDLAETKRKEAELMEGEQAYRRIVESADVGIWIVDAEERTGFANPRLARLLGCTVDEMVGRPASVFVSRAETPSARAGVNRDSEESAWRTLRRKNGDEISVRVATSPLWGENEQCVGTLAFVIPNCDSKSWTMTEPPRTQGRDMLVTHFA
jgi:PAS domain S-box-containing protein